MCHPIKTVTREETLKTVVESVGLGEVRDHVTRAQVLLEVLFVLGEADGSSLVQNPVTHALRLLRDHLLSSLEGTLLHD